MKTVDSRCIWALLICASLMIFLLFIFSGRDDGGASASVHPRECIILLHGLCRSARSMAGIAACLRRSGYAVVNLDYASTRKTIGALAEQDLAPVVARCRRRGYVRIHLVTHSMGGIIARVYLQRHTLPPGSRVVMLAPPNQGSELTDWALAHMPRIYALAGPAARELGTGEDAGLEPGRPLAAQIGVIAGNSSWNPVFSAILPGDDDGKVTVKRTRLAGMADFLIVADTHMMIMYDRDVQRRIIHFLKCGRFE